MDASYLRVSQDVDSNPPHPAMQDAIGLSSDYNEVKDISLVYEACLELVYTFSPVYYCGGLRYERDSCKGFSLLLRILLRVFTNYEEFDNFWRERLDNEPRIPLPAIDNLAKRLLAATTDYKVTAIMCLCNASIAVFVPDFWMSGERAPSINIRAIDVYESDTVKYAWQM